jgi:hypothetical protein
MQIAPEDKIIKILAAIREFRDKKPNNLSSFSKVRFKNVIGNIDIEL